MNELPARLQALIDSVPDWAPIAGAAFAAMLVLAMAASYVFARVSARRRVRHLDHAAAAGSSRANLKLEIGFMVVQGGLSLIIMQGVYECFHQPWLMNMPRNEAALFAAFVEAAMWTVVGMIREHGRTPVETTKDGTVITKKSTGWGMAGPFFWLITVAGGVLAVIAAAEPWLGVARAIVVVIGASLWVLRLMRVTQRPERRSQFRWTPYRIGVAWGWIEPDPQDSGVDGNTQWRVQRLARAIRLVNSPGKAAAVTRWWGRRSLTKLAEETTPEVLRLAQERYAAVHVLRNQALTSSELMKTIIGTVERTTVALAQIGEQAAIATGRTTLNNGRPPNRREITGEVVIDVEPGDQVPADGRSTEGGNATVEPIAGQLAKDRDAAVAIVTVVSRLAGIPRFPTWDAVRQAIVDGRLLNAIDRESAALPGHDRRVTKPRVGRILQKAETLYPVPPEPEPEEMKADAKSA